MAENRFLNFLRGNPSRSEIKVSKEQFIVVGLGNPGKEYEKNRHNVGFMAVDLAIEKFGFFGKKIKSNAVVVEGDFEGKKIIFVKPQTFMNLSGQAVSSLVRFYKVPLDHVIVIHDDIDLPFGTIRLRPGGGAGGQKGVSSIIQQLGEPGFARLRIGIGRPPGRMDAATYVLKNFHNDEINEIPFVLENIVEALKTLISLDLETAMNKFNGIKPEEG
jgi:PTH1 family peptidyl-tRNA hydrolase